MAAAMRRVRVRTCPFCRRPLARGSARRCNVCRRVVCVKCFDIAKGVCPACRAKLGSSRSNDIPNYIV